MVGLVPAMVGLVPASRVHRVSGGQVQRPVAVFHVDVAGAVAAHRQTESLASVILTYCYYKSLRSRRVW